MPPGSGKRKSSAQKSHLLALQTSQKAARELNKALTTSATSLASKTRTGAQTKALNETFDFLKAENATLASDLGACRMECDKLTKQHTEAEAQLNSARMYAVTLEQNLGNMEAQNHALLGALAQEKARNQKLSKRTTRLVHEKKVIRQELNKRTEALRTCNTALSEEKSQLASMSKRHSEELCSLRTVSHEKLAVAQDTAALLRHENGLLVKRLDRAKTAAAIDVTVGANAVRLLGEIGGAAGAEELAGGAVNTDSGEDYMEEEDEYYEVCR